MAAFSRVLGVELYSCKVFFLLLLSTVLYGVSSGRAHFWLFSFPLEMFGLALLLTGRWRGRRLRPWEQLFALINYRILIVLSGTYWLVGSHQMVFPNSYLITSILLCYLFGYIVCVGILPSYLSLRLFPSAKHEWQKLILIFFVMLFWEFGVYLWPANSWLSFGYSDYAVKVFYWLGHFGARFVFVLIKTAVLYFMMSGRLNFRWGTAVMTGALLLLVTFANIFTKAPMPGTHELSFAILQKGKFKAYGQEMKDALHVIDVVSPEINADLPDIVVWPENFFTGFVNDVDSLWRRIAREMPTQHVGGSIKFYDETYRSTIDSVIGGEIQRQSKGTAFPLGEQMPFLKALKSLGLIDKDYRNITVDRNYQLFNIHKYPESKFLGLVCLDGFNPWLISSYLWDAKSKTAPVFMIEVFNETLFGTERAARQHLALMRIMSASFGLQMVHGGQAGISAFIRADGSLDGIMSYGQDGILRGKISF